MTDLVIYNAETQVFVPPVGGRGTSYNLKTVAGMRGQYRAIVGADFKLDDLIKETIQVEHLVVHWIPDTGENAEPGALRPRGVLVAPDGTRISTGSLTALRGLMEVALIVGAPPPWKPALKFLVRSEPRKVGAGHYLWLDWIIGE